MIDVGAFSAQDLAPVRRKFAERVAAGDKVINFRINSFGGSVFDGLDLIQQVTDARARGVWVRCVVDTKAMSMGFVFLQTACDDRMMTPRAVLLTHNGSTGAQGTVDDLEEAMQMVRALNDAMARVCAARMGMPLERYKAKIRRHAWTMSADEALAVRAVDRVVDPLLLPPSYSL